jgi:hypothetical protein
MTLIGAGHRYSERQQGETNARFNMDIQLDVDLIAPTAMLLSEQMIWSPALRVHASSLFNHRAATAYRSS